MSRARLAVAMASSRKLRNVLAVEPLPCSMCGALAVLPLDAATLAKQPDGTTHVCHPDVGGCDHGFELVL